MRIEVDADLCVGHGRCYASAPEVFEPDEVGYNAARGSIFDVKPELKSAAQFGLDSCPESAIAWTASV